LESHAAELNRKLPGSRNEKAAPEVPARLRRSLGNAGGG